MTRLTADVNGSGPDLSGLDPDPWEAQQLEEVLSEIELEDLGDDPPYDFAGPGDDEPPGYSGLERASAALDAQIDTDASRLGEDIQDAIADTRRPKFEDKLARAFDRLAGGTYAPSAVLAPARDAARFTSGACGDDLDAFGRCASRFHQVGCREVTRAAAATGSATAVEHWRTQLLANQETSGIDLAAPAGLDRDWADLLSPDSGPGVPGDLETLNAMREQLGITSRELPNPARFGQGVI
jgi:hypothetical protein